MIIDRRSFFAGAAGAAACAALPAFAKGRSFLSRHSLSLGLQLYTLGDLPRQDLPGTLGRIAALGYRELELPGLLGFSPEDMRAAADKAGLTITSVHLPGAAFSPNDPLSIEGDAGTIARAMKVLGVRQAVMPMLILPKFAMQPGEDPKQAITRAVREAGTSVWEQTVAVLNDKGRALHEEGVALSYHNHNLEFAPAGATTGWDYIVTNTDPKLVSFEVDLGWVVAAGLDPVAVISKLSGRLRQVHVKDVKSSTVPNTSLAMDPAEVGAGSIDWHRVLPAAWDAGARHFYVEQEPPFAIDRFEAIARSAAFLKKVA